MNDILIYYITDSHLKQVSVFFVTSKFYIFLSSLTIVNLSWDFEEILLVNNKVPVIGKHMPQLFWNFNLVPELLNLISF